MNSRGKHETEHKAVEIQTYIHAFIMRKLLTYHISEPFAELRFEADECTAWSYMCWNRVPKGRTCEGEADFKQVYSGFGQYHRSRWGTTVVANKKMSLRYWGARFRKALKTSTALFSISFSRSGSSPKCCSLALVVNDKSGIINFAALLWRELSLWQRISLQPSQTVDV